MHTYRRNGKDENMRSVTLSRSRGHRRLSTKVAFVLALLFLLVLSLGWTIDAADFELAGTSGIWTSAHPVPDGIGTSQIRWGKSTGQGRSGFDFEGTGSQSFDAGEEFLIGTFTHHNRPIYDDGKIPEWVDLEVALEFTQPPILPNPTFTFRLEFEETPNIPGHCPSWQQSSTPCDDRVDFPLTYPQESYRLGDKLYTLEIVGFVGSYPGGRRSRILLLRNRKKMWPTSLDALRPCSCPSHKSDSLLRRPRPMELLGTMRTRNPVPASRWVTRSTGATLFRTPAT